MKKRILSLLCIAGLLCTLVVPAGGTAVANGDQAEPATRPADINDALAILKHIAGIRKLYLAEQWLYDFNNSGFDGDGVGVLDIMDALIVLKGLAGIGELPVIPKGYVQLEPLSKELELRIKEDWLKFVNYNGNPEDVIIAQYLGTYNDSVALLMSGDGEMLQALWTEIVAGFDISQPTFRPIRIWNDGEFYLVTKAFNDSLLTERDIEGIWNNRKAIYQYMY